MEDHEFVAASTGELQLLINIFHLTSCESYMICSIKLLPSVLYFQPTENLQVLTFVGPTRYKLVLNSLDVQGTIYLLK